jgi:hypothetical protein
LSAGLIPCRSRPWGSPFRVDFTSGASVLSNLLPSCGWLARSRQRTSLWIRCRLPRSILLNVSLSRCGTLFVRVCPTSGLSSPLVFVSLLVVLGREGDRNPPGLFLLRGLFSCRRRGLPRNPSSPELHSRPIGRELPFRVFPAKESAPLRWSCATPSKVCHLFSRS